MARSTVVAISLLVLAGVALVAASEAAPTQHGPGTREWLIEATRGGGTSHLRADSVPGFDCKWREAAYKYAKKLQPARGNLQSVFEALQLGAMCNQTIPEGDDSTWSPSTPLPDGGTTFYCDATTGSDSGSGSITSPFKTIQRGVDAAATAGGTVTLVLRAGTFYLSDTIVLGAEHSGLTIQNYKDEVAVVSGGTLVHPTWAPYNVKPGAAWNVESGMNAVYGGVAGDYPYHLYGKTASAADCQAACNANDTCNVFTWHDPETGSYANQCWWRLDSRWDLTPEADHISGCRVGKVEGCYSGSNIYVADLSTAGLKNKAYGFQMDGQRAILARYPNANPEVDLFPKGWISASTKWTPPRSYPNPKYFEDASPVRNESTMFQNYMAGEGGPCSVFDPDVSYWCSEHPSGGGAFQYKLPTGLTYTDSLLPHTPYKNGAEGALIDAWRPGHWANWFFEVDSYNEQASTIGWTRGGFQGARGDSSGQEWYIANVFDELDYPGEFYYNETSQKMYFYYNGTGPPPPDATFVVPQLEVLFNVSGTQQLPVKGVTFRGIKFTAAATTILAPHSVPSGGDWGLERLGAVFFQGTESAMVDSCLFERVDGNGIMVSGYNRGFTAQNSEFVWIGNTAMAAWGYTRQEGGVQTMPYGQGIDGTGGTQPRGCKILNNLIHEVGLYEKQSSCWFQGKTADTHLQGNICFNGPRAGFNVNDGFGGANNITENLLFNQCRETSDHGPFNSWDRQPFITEVADGKTASVVPAFNSISRNFMVANYGANGGCVDNDDGSSWYHLHHNFFIFGGHKSDFGGHSKLSEYNINYSPQVYGPRCLALMDMPLAGFNEGYYNNKCVLTEASPVYASIAGCDATKPSSFHVTMHGNTLYTAAAPSVSCGKTYTFEAWMALGLDKGTSMQPVPTADEIIAWGQELLGW